MSNEISVQIQLSCLNGEFKLPVYGTPHSLDQNGIGGGGPGYLLVGTGEEDIALTDLTTPGYLYIKNIGPLSGTSQPIITFGPKSGGSLIPFCDLKTGEEACFRLTGTSPTLRIKSDTADTQVQAIVLED